VADKLVFERRQYITDKLGKVRSGISIEALVIPSNILPSSVQNRSRVRFEAGIYLRTERTRPEERRWILHPVGMDYPPTSQFFPPHALF
jgi:hypothetical protein